MSQPNSPIEFPDDLPISAHVVDIARAIDAHPVVIVAGETGSGKTTQLPKICLAMGRGLHAHIGVTQPRRIATTSVAARVAKELNVELGREVGYKIRFSDKSSRQTYVKFMTDGILLAEIQGDPTLKAYDTVIIDEAHERSLNIDFLLGYLKRLLPTRPDLRVIISSATLETQRFSEFYGGAPVIQVSGRTHPVELIYRPQKDDENELAETVANTVEEITELDPREDILVFLPGEREIHETMEELASHGLPHTVLLPLYGRLPHAEQQRVFQTLPERRIVLATNVAETSLTIPGIVYVIDAGLARINRYSPRSGVTQLQIEPISRASADQRKGRAGRVRSGVAFRLYTEQDYESRLAYTDPEILRVGLAGAILQMKAMGLGRIEQFPFLDPPPKKAVDEGYRVLEELGAIDEGGEITDVGKKLARLPLDPRLGRMIIAGEREGALREVLIIAAALGVQDPRERPLAAQKQADQAHRRFKDEESDFAGLLKLWHFYQDAQSRLSRNQLKKTCRDSYLSHLRMREWSDIHHQLSQIARDMGFRPKDTPAKGDAIHRALCTGLLSRIGMWNQEQRVYVGARQTRFHLHPSSGLANKPPSFVIAAELVETTKLFARTAARVDPAWLEPLAGHLIRRHYADPHWAEKPAQVMAKEQLSLYGLPIVRDRKVHYGPIDPLASRKIFILHALVRGEFTTRAAFIEHNKKLLAQVERLRDKARRSDMLADEHALELFFDARVPEGVYSGKTFEAWRKSEETSNPNLLELSLEDVLVGDDADLTPERYPDSLELYGVRLPLSYRFDPGEDDDGVTITLPLVLLPQTDPGIFAWTIPGWHADKILYLLESLPKATRKPLGSLKELAAELARDLRPFEAPMLPELADAIFDRTGERVMAHAFRVEELPPYLRFYFRITGEDDRVIGEGRDLVELKERLEGRARALWTKAPRAGIEREGLVSWSFAELPERVTIEIAGKRAFAYPALVDEEKTVSLVLLSSPEAAREATAAGLRRLYLLQMGSALSKLEAQLPTTLAMSPLADQVAPGKSGLRRQIALRALDDAFQIDVSNDPPRSRAAFNQRFEAGRRRLQSTLPQLGQLAQEISAEFSKAKSTLAALSGKPGAPKSTLDEVRTQMAYLLPAGLFRHTPIERLAHIPRYLRAISVRLDRLPNGPQKDQAKAAQVLPLWQEYLKHHEGLSSRGVPAEELESFRWLLEELRVSIFAPELKTAVPVSVQRLTEQWKGLSR